MTTLELIIGVPVLILGILGCGYWVVRAAKEISKNYYTNGDSD